MKHLDIMDISKNSTTGLITAECRVLDLDAAKALNVVGVVERWHVEALEIETKYGGQVSRWLEHVGREMLHRHKLRTAIHDDVSRWHGQKMEIVEGAVGSPPILARLDIKP